MVSLYEHQRQAIDKLRPGSILCGGVGTGKSRTSLAYFYLKVLGGDPEHMGEVQRGVDLYIITTARKRDTYEWDEELIPFGLGVGNNKFGEHEINVVIDSWNNIKKYVDVKQSFFIFDEQRLVGSGAWVKAFLRISSFNKWILLSATPGDTWMEYIPVFVANGFYRNRTEFIRKHVVFNRFVKYPKVERYLNEERLEKCKQAILVPMPTEWHSVQKHEYISVPYDEARYKDAVKRRWDIYKDEPMRDAGSLCYICRHIVNESPERLRAVGELLYNHPKAIIFYNFNYELELLREYLDNLWMIPYSEWNGHKHEKILTGDTWVYLVQYTAGSEGWNCYSTDTIIFYSQNYSYKVMHQAAGRTNRINSPFTELYYFHLISQSPIDMAIKQALSNKKDFNERSFEQAVSTVQISKEYDAKMEQKWQNIK